MSTALEYYEDHRGLDVLERLDEHFAPANLPTQCSPHHDRVFKIYNDDRDNLYHEADGEVSQKTKLEKLEIWLYSLIIVVYP